MIAALIQLALRHRLVVLSAALGIAALGIWTFGQQQIDAYPDISAQVVTIITTYPGRAPEEVERQVTIPIELAMGSVPKLASSESIKIMAEVPLSFR